jgi:hypothetical protein
MKTESLASAFALALLALFPGCVAPMPDGPLVRDVPMETKFDPASLGPYRQTGTAAIIGQAFLTTRGGDVKVGAGREVTLFPATAFFREATVHIDRGYRPAAYQTVRDQFLAVAHRTQADAGGNFEFRDLPPGDYMLEVEISWEVPGRYGLYKSGDIIRKFVSVADGQQVRAMLTK